MSTANSSPDPAIGGINADAGSGDPPGLVEEPKTHHIKTGRNLPVAIGVGAVLGGLVVLTLLTVKATFLIYVGVALAIALSELAGALAKRDIRIPVVPVAAVPEDWVAAAGFASCCSH